MGEEGGKGGERGGGKENLVNNLNVCMYVHANSIQQEMFGAEQMCNPIQWHGTVCTSMREIF